MIISHFEAVFRCFHEKIADIQHPHANFLPLLPNKKWRANPIAVEPIMISFEILDTWNNSISFLDANG